MNEETSWLPPDNYQVSHQHQLAMRTSPTNIGLYLVSVLSAHDFGYLTVDDVVQKLARTMETIAKLERHEGHLLNWYDIQTLAAAETALRFHRGQRQPAWRLVGPGPGA